jgi:ATP-dependent RNA helicase RhlE
MTINKENMESPDFYGLGIAPKLLKILEQLKFTTPTPIQFKSIPVTVEGKDIVGIAQTGTGKTLAFGIPMIQRLAQHKGRGLVLLPTRELAIQVDEHLKMIGQKIGLRTAVLIGGEPIGKQIKILRRNPHILVATPGRLIDHLQNKFVNLNDIKILVLDEADMMFDMGFAPQIEQILKMVPKERQTMLFSATMPPAIMRIVTKHMSLPINIEVAPSGTPAESVIQEMIVMKSDEKIVQLEKIIKEHAGTILVFSRTKHNAKNLCVKINRMGHRAAEIHSNRSLVQRREALSGFKNGRYRVLVATDIAARGIDVVGIEIVVNYDLPDNTEDYVHRIGRTGRAGKAGRAISFVLPGQIVEIRNIERLIKKNIPITGNLGNFRTDRKEQIRRFTPRRGSFNAVRPNFPGKISTYKSKNTSSYPSDRQSESSRQPSRTNTKRTGMRSDNPNRSKKFNYNPDRYSDDKNLTDKQRYRRSLR